MSPFALITGTIDEGLVNKSQGVIAIRRTTGIVTNTTMTRPLSPAARSHWIPRATCCRSSIDTQSAAGWYLYKRSECFLIHRGIETKVFMRLLGPLDVCRGISNFHAMGPHLWVLSLHAVIFIFILLAECERDRRHGVIPRNIEKVLHVAKKRRVHKALLHPAEDEGRRTG